MITRAKSQRRPAPTMGARGVSLGGATDEAMYSEIGSSRYRCIPLQTNDSGNILLGYEAGAPGCGYQPKKETKFASRSSLFDESLMYKLV
jgi:hypothetical protein